LSNTPTPTLPGESRIVDASRWSVVNLIFSIVGVVFVVLVAIWVLLLKRKEDAKVEQNKANAKTGGNNMGRSGQNSDSVDEKFVQRGALWLIVTVVLAIISVVVFLLTENTKLPMGWVDKWTVVNAVILIVEIITIYICLKTVKQTQQKEST
jgi:Ca2+/Na+ antiporter